MWSRLHSALGVHARTRLRAAAACPALYALAIATCRCPWFRRDDGVASARVVAEGRAAKRVPVLLRGEWQGAAVKSAGTLPHATLPMQFRGVRRCQALFLGLFIGSARLLTS